MDSNTRLKSIIELMTCPVHAKKPYVEILDKKIEIMCCCTDFKIICLKKMANVLVEMNNKADKN